MKTKVKVSIFTIAMSIILAGCCLSHDWQEAACTEPKTCAKCEETEGEALGHTWTEATCSEPKTCNVCGETEGEALEHTLTEANYQQAPVCTVCGETVGEPLVAEYNTNGMGNILDLNVAYDYVTQCYSDVNYPTTGKITVSINENNTIEGEFEELEGYEWQVVTAIIVFYDNNARDFGCSAPYWIADYYNISAFSDSYNQDTGTWTVNYNGVDYTECKVLNECLYNEWNVPGVKTIINRHAVRVPVGYDGMVINYFDRNSSIASEDMEEWYVDDIDNENTMSFRMSSACSISDKTVIKPVTAESLTVEDARRIMEEQIKPLYVTILEAEETRTFYDLDKDGQINDMELDRFFGWLLVRKDDSGTSSAKNLTDEEVLEYIELWLNYGIIGNPDYIYYFDNGKQIIL